MAATAGPRARSSAAASSGMAVRAVTISVERGTRIPMYDMRATTLLPAIGPAPGSETGVPVVTEDAERGAFSVRSPTVPQRPAHVRALLDAWLPGPDLARTDDPLLRSLLDTGLARTHHAGAPCAGTVTGAADVELPGLRVRDAAGRSSKRLFAKK